MIEKESLDLKGKGINEVFLVKTEMNLIALLMVIIG